MQVLVVQRGRVAERLEVREDGHRRQRAADVRLDALEQVVPLLHRPVRRHQHVQRDEAPRAGLARAQRVVLDAVARRSDRAPAAAARSRSAGSAASIRPGTESRTMRPPVQTMLAATTSATIGSSRCQPVTATAPTPTSTPAEVQTSVSRWCALASSVDRAMPSRRPQQDQRDARG